MTEDGYLILFDADRIKDFVFATGRLKEIRGGSQLVRDATDQESLEQEFGLKTERQKKETIVFAEGGSGVLLAPDAVAAQKMCRDLESRYRLKTRGATLSVVAEPLRDDFQMAIKRAARQLRLAKDNRLDCLQIDHSPFARPCASCGSRAACEAFGPNAELLCPACLAKREKSKAMRRRSEKALYLREVSWGDSFFKTLPESATEIWDDARLPEELSELAALSRPDNYLGYLYADGNGLGKLVQQQSSVDDYRRFSRRVSYSLQAALWLALQQHFPSPIKGIAPFELIALGGDDLILVTTADRVMRLAWTLSKLFQQISAGLDRVQDPDQMTLAQALAIGRKTIPNLGREPVSGQAFTLSVGIVIAHPGQPVLNLQVRAAELLNLAKREFPGQAALDFHVVSSPVLRDIDAIRAEEYVVEQARLTGRPMLTENIDRLVHHILEFKAGGEEASLPRSQLYALYAALYRGQDAASFEAFFVRSRLNQKQRQKLDNFFADFGLATPNVYDFDKTLPPWGQDPARDPKTFTTLGDLMELYEFIHEGAKVRTPMQTDEEAANDDS